MSEKSSRILRNMVRDTNLHWDLREEALDELIEREELEILKDLARDTNLHWDLREKAMRGIKGRGK